MAGNTIESMHIKIEILVQMIVFKGRCFMWWINALYFFVNDL